MIRFATKIETPAGAYLYPNRARMEVSSDRALLVSDGVGRSAGRASFGQREVSRRISLKGELYAQGDDGPLALQQLKEAFAWAHRPLDPDRNPSEPAHHRLFFVEGTGADAAATRVYDVAVRSVVLGEWAKPLRRLPFSLEMETGEEPFEYSPTPISVPLLVTNGAATVVTSPGTAWSYPILTITVTRAAAGTLRLVNETNGRTFTLRPSAAGVYVIDTAANRVTLAGADAIGDMDDEFIEIEGGVNHLRLLYTGGVAATAAVCAFPPRWY